MFQNVRQSNRSFNQIKIKQLKSTIMSSLIVTIRKDLIHIEFRCFGIVMTKTVTRLMKTYT